MYTVHEKLTMLLLGKGCYEVGIWLTRFCVDVGALNSRLFEYKTSCSYFGRDFARFCDKKVRFKWDAQASGEASQHNPRTILKRDPFE